MGAANASIRASSTLVGGSGLAPDGVRNGIFAPAANPHSRARGRPYIPVLEDSGYGSVGARQEKVPELVICDLAILVLEARNKQKGGGVIQRR